MGTHCYHFQLKGTGFLVEIVDSRDKAGNVSKLLRHQIEEAFGDINEILVMDVGNDHQWVITSEKSRQPDILCFLVEIHTTTHKIFLTKNTQLWVC